MCLIIEGITADGMPFRAFQCCGSYEERLDRYMMAEYELALQEMIQHEIDMRAIRTNMKIDRKFEKKELRCLNRKSKLKFQNVNLSQISEDRRLQLI